MTPSRHHPARQAVAALIAAVALGAAFPGVAAAALSIQPNAPALGFPASVTDPVSGIALTSCQDLSGFCLETPPPTPAATLSVPGNYTPDGEAFYNVAQATVPNAGLGVVVLALEQAFTTAAPTAGQQIMFARTRFRFTSLKADTTYRVTYPYGVAEFTSNATGGINDTVDAGCLAPPCDFAAADFGVVTSFLQWDPTVAPAAPAGYVGNVNVAHKIIGSPLATNFVRLEELSGPGGLVVGTVGETALFNVQGKLAGPAPAPAPFALPDVNALSFAARQVGATGPAGNLTLANHGTAPLKVTDAALGGTDGGDFAVATNTCTTPVPPGQSCTLGVTFTPRASGARSATLTVASDALNGPHTFALAGTGSPASLPAPDPVVLRVATPATTIVVPAARSSDLRATALRTPRSVKSAQLRSRGLAVSFSAPRDAGVARLRLLRAGRAGALATKLVALTATGRQTLHLRARDVRPGRYRLEVALGATARELGGTVTTAVTVTRR